MIQANNRMMDRLEDLFHQQQQFTSDVAHELRTPASIISAECQYLKKYGGTINDYMDSLTVIARQNAKTNEIITQLLQLSRLEQGRIKKTLNTPV
ncbi:MAG: histidine kinase dimerization/phospho-acceptor domain-containing protein [Anaerobutyricum sp.]